MESLPHRVVLKVDTLDQENRRFDQVPLREETWQVFVIMGVTM